MDSSPAPGERASVTVVGIGADGWSGLPEGSRHAVAQAQVLFGSARQFALVPPTVTARRHPWPTPLLAALPRLLAEHADRSVVLLASGDPTFFGIGTTVAGLLGPEHVRILPAPSSVSLACARLGWPAQDVLTVSLLGRPAGRVLAAARRGRPFLVLLDSDDAGPRTGRLLTEHGFGSSRLTLLCRLGGTGESITRGTAASWAGDPRPGPAILAVEPQGPVAPLTPGLAVDLFDHDGQITKPEVRAVTLAALAPRPGELLWDVGAGSGSVGIEWMRTDPTCRTIAVEPRTERADRIATNAAAFGLDELQVVSGSAPAALAGLPRPDAVFVGGGLSRPGVLDACLAALGPGGRLVANAVTVETELVVLTRHGTLGGSLTRISIDRAEPVGGFTGWRPSMPITQWTYTVPDPPGVTS